MTNPNLTGESSVFPYGIDTFQVQRNYESPDLSEQGDVIRASVRNHIADVITGLEGELLSAAKSAQGDLLVSCLTVKISSYGYLSSHSIVVPQDILDFISDGQALETTTLPVVVQFGIRPLTIFDIWQGIDTTRAQIFPHSINGNTIIFTMCDPTGAIQIQPTRQQLNHIGDYLVSVILLRQK